MLLLLLVFIGFRKGWWTKWSQTPMAAAEPQFTEGAVEEEGGDNESDAADGENAEEADPPDEATAKRYSKTGARDELHKRRAKTKSDLRFAAWVLARRHSSFLFAGAVALTKPIKTSFEDDICKVKTPRGTLALQTELATQGYWRVSSRKMRSHRSLV